MNPNWKISSFGFSLQIETEKKDWKMFGLKTDVVLNINLADKD